MYTGLPSVAGGIKQVFFSLNFRFTSIFSLNFRLFYLRFRFRFLVFRIEVNHVKSGFFFASKRNEIFASISNFASEAKVRAHPSTDEGLPYEKVYIIKISLFCIFISNICFLFSLRIGCQQSVSFYH